ncbi:MAG: hypothetical protein ACK5LL_06950 [Suipraeoptans sp.]
MAILKDLNIVRGDDTQAALIFEELYSSFMDIVYQRPSEYVQVYWNAYLAVRDVKIPNEQTRRGINGKIFEYILATLLIREKIYPIYMNAKVAFVPNINYDLLLYSTKEGPICLSAKVSFRERYKQADLEAIALKYVHRKSKSYLITLSPDDAVSVNEKQKIGDVIGLDKAIYALNNDLDNLVSELKGYNLVNAPTVEVIESKQIITESVVRAKFDNY